MSSLIPFRFDSYAVRVIDVDGSPWFVAKDVALALDYTWTGTQRIEHVPEEWRGVTSVVTPYGAQEMAVLSEQGLYFFVCRSDKPKALPFQKWLAGDVLPAIRRTGEYRTPSSAAPSADLPRLRAQRDALWAWLIELKPEVGKIARYRQAGLTQQEVARALAWGVKRVRQAERRLDTAGLLPKRESMQLSLLEG